MKAKVLFYARKTVTFIIAIMSLLSLCFTYLFIKSKSISIDGVNQIAICGFDFISFPTKSVNIASYHTITLSNYFCLTIFTIPM